MAKTMPPPLIGLDEQPREAARLLDDDEVERMEAEEKAKRKGAAQP